MNSLATQPRRRFLATVALSLSAAALLATAPARAYDESSASAVNVDAGGLALKGHDPVAYFTNSAPVLGKTEFTAQHAGATYRFVSAVNRDAFVANPAKFAPAYGGFCAMGVALEKKLDVDPQAWRVVDGRLYLNVNKDVQKRWLDDVPGNLATAEKNWPRLKDRVPKTL
ncbi:MAG: YHS domain-containing (seleno)protein [Burkholderiaceae bacterium]|nr:YHS domain-containing (seleno)protein [Burkholderiaceae bacterium]